MFEHNHVGNSSSADGGWEGIKRRRQRAAYSGFDFFARVAAGRPDVAPAAKFTIADVESSKS